MNQSTVFITISDNDGGQMTNQDYKMFIAIWIIFNCLWLLSILVWLCRATYKWKVKKDPYYQSNFMECLMIRWDFSKYFVGVLNVYFDAIMLVIWLVIFVIRTAAYLSNYS